MSRQDASLNPASILGIGAITPLGRDMASITQLLSMPGSIDSEVLRVHDELLTDSTISRRMRRADRFGKMAALAAIDAWNDSQSLCADVPKERIGLIVASGFGPHCRGFRFLDGILDCGDSAALPTDFSHSVHGAAAAYITEILGLRGPSLSITDFEVGFEQAVQLAQCWLHEGGVDRVLVGAVEEVGEVMLHSAASILKDRPGFRPGEGAVFLMLGASQVAGFAQLDATIVPGDVQLLIRDEPELSSPSGRVPTLSSPQAITFTPYFGHSAISSAFHLLGGILSQRARRPLGERIDPNSDQNVPLAAVDNVAICRRTWNSRVATLHLKNTSQRS
jgi:3-oxoacyl-[acyl-carrier-protein] synthase II